MIHDDAGLAAFLDGDVDETEAAAWDDHLLSCDDCWNALDEARRGQELASSLREAAPAVLRARIVTAVGAGCRGYRPRRRLAIALASMAAAVLALATAVVATVHDSGGIHDAEPVAVVLRLAADRTQVPPQERRGVRITRLNVGGRDVVLARSDDPFPMPAGAIALADDPNSPWLAKRGEVNLLCFSHPDPILLAGRASPETLTQVAVALGISVPGRNQTGGVRRPFGVNRPATQENACPSCHSGSPCSRSPSPSSPLRAVATTTTIKPPVRAQRQRRRRRRRPWPKRR